MAGAKRNQLLDVFFDTVGLHSRRDIVQFLLVFISQCLLR